VGPLTARGASPQVNLRGTAAPGHNPAVSAMTERLIGARHGGVDDFRVFDFAVVQKTFANLTRGTEVLAALIAGVALLAGSAGIMNILLVSLNLQIVEIGTRRALGADNGAIAAQFAAEGALLSACGALVGLLGAWVTLRLAGLWITRIDPTWSTHFAAGVCLVAVTTTLVAGTIAGLVPARRAARWTVVDCLRQA
jgi:ABC-type antimicrobial peptide transport system permease subunit